MRYQYLEEKCLPLWNPYQAYGVPLAANMQSQPFYPLSLLLALHPNPRTYNFYLLLRLFAAGLGCYLFGRLFVSFTPALAAGIACMLGGYFLLFLTIPELSVAILLPWFLLAGEHLLRNGNYWSIVSVSFVILLVFLGGGPETTLLFFTFSYLYFVIRLFSDAALRAHWKKRTLELGIATLAGLALSMPVILPFAEYLPDSWNNHEPAHLGGSFRGIEHDRGLLALFTYVFPLIFGPVDTTVPPYVRYGLRNYFGLVALFLLLAACAAAFGRRMALPTLRAPTLFFAAVVLFVLLKRFGLVVNFVGALPLFRLLDFPKYQELLLSVSVAVLCAIGLEHIRREAVAVRTQCALLAVTFAMIPLSLLLGWKAIGRAISQNHIDSGMPAVALILPAGLLMCIALLFLTRRHASKPGIVAATTALLAVEFCGNYIYPMYYQFARMPAADVNPYAGAPYVNYLKSHCKDNYRIVGQNGILVPNWAAAFHIFDIRYLDALYVGRYFPWLENFFPGWEGVAPELSQCFRGLTGFDFANPATQRLLQLSSIKYIVGARFVAPADPTIHLILDQSHAALISGRERQVSEQTFSIGDESRQVLGEHPPYTRLPYRVAVPTTEPVFHFSYGIDSGAWTQPGDGVEFTLEVRDAKGTIRRLYSNYIDPKHNLRDRHWMDEAVDLSPYRGQMIELLFSTSPGPRNDVSADWAGWSDLYFGPRHVEPENPFRPVYNKEVKISEYDRVLPRAAIYYGVELVSSDQDVLERLANPALDLFRTVVLNRKNLSPEQEEKVTQLANSSKPVDAARLVSYKSQEVMVDASPSAPALLMLNDTDFPGWQVEIDGKRSNVIRADYYFRGVYLNPGHHRVRFVYRPRAFRVGLLISAATLLAFVVFGYALYRPNKLAGNLN